MESFFVSMPVNRCVTLRNLPDEFYRHFYRSANVKSFDAGSYFADGDDTWVWDALVVVAVKDATSGPGGQ
jgi:hypothetical protein